MKTHSYYSFFDGEEKPSIHACSRESQEAPLIVNCAGNLNTAFPFTTENPVGRFDYYLMYITSGSLKVRAAKEAATVCSGDTVIIPPRCPYSYTYSGGDPLNYMWVHFTGSATELYLGDMDMLPLPTVRHSSRDGRTAINFRTLFDIFSVDDKLRPHALAAALLQLLTEISRSFIKNKENPIARSLRYIDASYTEDIRIPDLAAMEGLSSSRYYVIFKEQTGMAPGEYIIDMRLRHACELLRTTDMSVKQIGISVGYTDPHYFSKQFKVNIGLSPTEYREG